MTQNMFYGGDDYDLKTGGFCPVSDGCPLALHRIAATIKKAKADIVGLQETERNTAVLAGLLGWYSSPRAHVISRYPIIEPPGSGGMYVFVEPAPGRVVAIADFHLPSTPYGPYEVRDGATHQQVIKLENTIRVPYMQTQLAALKRLEAQGYPIFATGDFNSPSYLDWTAAVAKVRSDVPYPVRWPVSYTFAQGRLRRLLPRHPPGPRCDTGLHLDAGRPGRRSARGLRPDRLGAARRSGPDAGQHGGRRGRRPGRGHHGARAVPLGPPRRRVDLRRARRSRRRPSPRPSNGTSPRATRSRCSGS